MHIYYAKREVYNNCKLFKYYTLNSTMKERTKEWLLMVTFKIEIDTHE